MIQLPHKLSELAQMALDDVTAVEQMPGYEIQMGIWHQSCDGTCAVCAAGSVMVQRLGVTHEDYLPRSQDFTERFGEHNARALLAIDSLRSGDVGEAIATLETGYDAWLKHGGTHSLDRDVAEYDDLESSGAWHADMTKLIADLREAGL